MKRIVFLLAALLAIAVGFAQLSDFKSMSLRLFLDERADIERMERSGNTHGLEMYKPQFAAPRVIDGVEMVDAFIDIDDPGVIATLKAHGVKVNCVFDGFVTAQVPTGRLTEVLGLPGVVNLEISRLMELCSDSTLSVTHAGQVLNGPDFGLDQAYDGTGVIIGVIDNGFDFQHTAFRRVDDPTRSKIVRVYNTTADDGHPVMIDDAVLPGSVYMDEQIDSIRYDSNGTHGTHVASIAAGTHVAGYGGMAPGAELVLCVAPSLNVGLQEAEVVNCIKYIYSYADSVGKPCVINLSVSTPNGARDGNDRISKVVAQLSGPGRIFVIAAGNTGARNLYTHSPVTMEKPLHMLLSYYDVYYQDDASYFYSNFWSDIWVRDKGQRAVVSFHILDKATRRIVWESNLVNLYELVDLSEIEDYFVPDYSIDSTAYIRALISMAGSGKYVVSISIHNMRCAVNTINESNGNYISRYQFGLTVHAPRVYYPRQPDSVYVDSWFNATQSGRMLDNYSALVDSITEDGDTIPILVRDYYTKPSDLSSIGTYAVHDSVISAGAFIGRNSYYSLNNDMMINLDGVVGKAYNYSSYQAEGMGPTGKALPTVMAPGYSVVAAASRNSYIQTNHSIKDLVMRDENGCPWGVMTGTSMAAPTVAGIIAQWLQINPNLSTADVKEIIAQTAVKDAFYGPRFGPNGKIDAMAGVRYLLPEPPVVIIPGDVDGNGEVDIVDVTMMINYLLSDVPVGAVLEAGDYNGDGDIDIIDVTGMINYLLYH